VLELNRAVPKILTLCLDRAVAKLEKIQTTPAHTIINVISKDQHPLSIESKNLDDVKIERKKICQKSIVTEIKNEKSQLLIRKSADNKQKQGILSNILGKVDSSSEAMNIPKKNLFYCSNVNGKNNGCMGVDTTANDRTVVIPRNDNISVSSAWERSSSCGWGSSNEVVTALARMDQSSSWNLQDQQSKLPGSSEGRAFTRTTTNPSCELNYSGCRNIVKNATQKRDIVAPSSAWDEKSYCGWGDTTDVVAATTRMNQSNTKST
jgi:hypothetical protein